jgi:hypothetical protein
MGWYNACGHERAAGTIASAAKYNSWRGGGACIVHEPQRTMFDKVQHRPPLTLHTCLPMRALTNASASAYVRFSPTRSCLPRCPNSMSGFTTSLVCRAAAVDRDTQHTVYGLCCALLAKQHVRLHNKLGLQGNSMAHTACGTQHRETHHATACMLQVVSPPPGF